MSHRDHISGGTNRRTEVYLPKIKKNTYGFYDIHDLRTGLAYTPFSYTMFSLNFLFNNVITQKGILITNLQTPSWEQLTFLLHFTRWAKGSSKLFYSKFLPKLGVCRDNKHILSTNPYLFSRYLLIKDKDEHKLFVSK